MHYTFAHIPWRNILLCAAIALLPCSATLMLAGVPPHAGMLTLTAYDANELKYDVNSATGGIIVFSDIYYPGWTATVDGQDVPVGRVDYVLRAINVGKGQHKVVLTFKPKSVEITEGIAYCAYAVLFIAMLFIAYNEYKKRKILKDGNKE